jgi:hypothetical protein
MVTMLAIPWFASELVALLIGAVLALVVISLKRRPVKVYDVEEAIAEVTMKVRHPWTYRMRQWMNHGA